jgi:hypothetical protein
MVKERTPSTNWRIDLLNHKISQLSPQGVKERCVTSRSPKSANSLWKSATLSGLHRLRRVILGEQLLIAVEQPGDGRDLC